jgi:hypothetical protein
MHDLMLGLIVSGVVTVVMFVAGTLTAMYCRWADRADARADRDRAA